MVAPVGLISENWFGCPASTMAPETWETTCPPWRATVTLLPLMVSTFAISPSNCYGLWQEMGRRDALDPATSARIAVSMSHGGTNWGAWSTSGMC